MKIKEIQLHSGDRHTISYYPESGIYKVSGNDNIIEYYYVNKITNLVFFIDSADNADFIFQEEAKTYSNDILLLKLQLLKLTNVIDDSQYKQILAMLASGNHQDIYMAEESIKTLLNSNT